MGVPQRSPAATNKWCREVDLGAPSGSPWSEPRAPSLVVRPRTASPPPPPPVWRRLFTRRGLRLQLKLAWMAVVLVCVSLLVVQIADRVYTLNHPPISTESKKVYNMSMHYPAVTICHMEGFKQSVVRAYNQSWRRDTVNFSTRWSRFPWQNATLDQFWSEASYTPQETITTCQLGDWSRDGVCPVLAGKHAFSMEWRLQPRSGACTTLRPSAGVTPPPGRQRGIVLYLRSVPEQYDQPSAGVGWVVTAHDPRYSWSDLTTGWYDSVSLHRGEKVLAKLEASSLSAVDRPEERCATVAEYNVARCLETCVGYGQQQRYGCRPPWLPPDGHFPACSDAAHFEPLLNSALVMTDDFYAECRRRCIRPCENNFYSLYVMSIGMVEKLQSNNLGQLLVYYPTGLTASSRQYRAYGGVQFLADVGGLLGLLLGLSVLSLMQVLEQVCLWCASRYWNVEDSDRDSASAVSHA